MIKYKQFVSEAGSKAGFVKLKEGENRLRFVGNAFPFESDWGARFVSYVIDRSDGQLKPFTFGPQIAGQIGALANSTEYGFEELPPYDIIIIRVGSGKETEYTVNGARANSTLTEDEKAAIEKLSDIKKIADSLTKKTRAKQSSVIDAPMNDDEPPAEEIVVPF